MEACDTRNGTGFNRRNIFECRLFRTVLFCSLNKVYLFSVGLQVTKASEKFKKGWPSLTINQSLKL